MTRKVRFTIRNLTRYILLSVSVAICAFGLAACNLPPAPPPEPVTCIQDGSPQAAVCSAFADMGRRQVDIAMCIVDHESSFGTEAVGHYNGQTYLGMWQLNPRYYQGTMDAYGGNWFDPVAESLVARVIRDQRGNWSAWSTARGCGG